MAEPSSIYFAPRPASHSPRQSPALSRHVRRKIQSAGGPSERSVFEDDDEAIELWHKQGVPYDHISRLGEKDNFWAAGPTGPCGPCSEIYFDQGEEFGCGGEHCGPGCDDCDRYLEFWNLVFTQYDRQEDGSLPELPHRNIDTGMGLERIAAIMQHKSTNYDGDLLQGLIGVGEGLSGHAYGTDPARDRSLRIVARRVVTLIDSGALTDEAAEALGSWFDEAADAVQVLHRSFDEPTPAGRRQGRVGAREALGAAASRLHPTHLGGGSLHGEALVMLLRPIMVDLIEATGADHEEAVGYLPGV